MLQTKKLSLAAIQDKLSRNEMKQIMAGSTFCYSCVSSEQCWKDTQECRESTSCPGMGKVCAKKQYC